MKRIVKVLAVILVLSLMTVSSVYAAKLLPTGGSEWKYDPSAWTEKATHHSNCYFYAVMKVSSLTAELRTMQPGYLTDDPVDSRKELKASTIEKKVKEDRQVASSKGDFYKTTATKVPPKGYRKVALVIAPNEDYHWYEQNSNGYWSHKRGNATYPTNLDAANKKIADPETCKRKYVTQYLNMTGKVVKEKTLDYSTFCGYYMVR